MHSYLRPIAATAASAVVVLGAAGVAGSNPSPDSDGGRFLVGTTADTVDATPGDGVCADATGACSLRAAVQEANASAGGHLVLPPATYTLTLANADGDEEAAATGDLDITSSVSIEGYAATVDAAGLDRAFEVMEGATLDVDGLEVTGGLVTGGEDPISGSGGAFANAGTLMLDGVHLHENVADGPMASGGAILTTGELTVGTSTLTNNTATRAGGAIEANGGTTTVSSSRLIANTTGPAPGNGGAFHMTGEGRALFVSSQVEDNTAAAEGGGLWVSATGHLEVTGTNLTGNAASGAEADNGGGALFNDGGTLVVATSSITGNTADGEAGSGGGILNDGGSLDVDTVIIADNAARRAGGAIEADEGMTTLRTVTLDHNTAGPNPGNGGGLHITGNGDATIDGSRVTANTASSEGGGLWNGAGTMTVTNTRIAGNTASGDEADNGGGGLFNNGGTLHVADSAVTANVADGAAGSGGGILNDQGETTVTSSTLDANRSMRAGGAIEANVGVTRVTDSAIRHNTTGAAPGNGGGVHLTGEGTVEIDATDVSANTAAAEGGGVWSSATGSTNVNDSDISGNDAPVGPDTFNDGGSFTVDGTAVVPAEAS
ncbi:MAG: CSLREA domain-containing protein [Actinomycetota bacterium]|nr:CSLREA domain-containing protein [Actinomycetota bacterium]